jgi:hypothetical protein
MVSSVPIGPRFQIILNWWFADKNGVRSNATTQLPHTRTTTTMFAVSSVFTVRPAVKVTARKAVKVSAFYDPDQYDHDANSGRGSGYVATVSKPMNTATSTVSYGAKPTRVTRGVDGVVYDPDQFDADANVRSNAVMRPAGFASTAAVTSTPSYASVGAKPTKVVRASDGVVYDPDQYDPNP